MAEEQEVQTEEVHQDNEIETRARHMGWAPKEEFKGDPDKWVDADEFVKKGENIMPILKERNRALEAKVSEMERTLNELREFHSKAEERAYKRALEDIKAKRKEAIANGDADAFEEAETQMEELRESRQKVVEKPDKKAPSPEFVEWHSQNEWYGADQKATAYAESIAHFLMTENPRYAHDQKAFLNAVKEEVAKKFPEKFGNPRRSSGPSVEGDSKALGGKRGKTFNDLPADAKAQCARFERTIPGFTKEQYLKDFDWAGYEKTRA